MEITSAQSSPGSTPPLLTLKILTALLKRNQNQISLTEVMELCLSRYPNLPFLPECIDAIRSALPDVDRIKLTLGEGEHVAEYILNKANLVRSDDVKAITVHPILTFIQNAILAR